MSTEDWRQGLMTDDRQMIMYDKLGETPNLYTDPNGIPTYIVPPAAIPDGGYVLVNGCQIYFESEQRHREHVALARQEFAALRDPSRAGLGLLWWSLRRILPHGSLRR
jgi:hypothetical protein